MKDNETMMDYKRFIYKWHNNKILKKAVRFADLNEGDKVLDFGCEGQYLKRFLPKNEYVGFDIRREFSDVEDYTKLENVNTVFCLNVLEHIKGCEIRRIIKNFKIMGVKKLVVAFPIDFFASVIFNMFFEKGFARKYFIHVTDPKALAIILSEELGEPFEVELLNLSQILAVFVLKEKKK